MNMRTLLPVAALAALALPGLLAAQEGGRPYNLTMTGAAERPGPGDPDGTGTAEFRVNAGQRRVCYTLVVSNIGTPTAAHIHRAGPESPGPVVVPLTAPAASGNSHDCATVTRELAQELIQDPGAFYVNVHTAAFPAGAIRAQFSR
ncbi:MAG TPA: CHRD domain-containing protein [Allosphingosinicella sp.]